ncbi:FAD binding domain-containing protein [Thermogemmatispora tikiterensis]|uniref:Carbon monoxide dehydrogenase n=1 Tax=Thermogemmatispora tikiterensis TaxID=1825093 RepID=A0A328VQU0_9CHLR|nr:xanthine dehydrogenase family protein subunit M [Thermogemmatispora tikiterensis]RAQ98120.1 carbon monoxide dehydrogenase [Thermogemmatispora tikiterensis]
MIPATFEYHPASSVDEAIALLSQYGDDAKLLAGGHSLIPTMKLRLAQPAHLIDIGRIPGLSYIREEGNVVAVGALTTYATIERSEVLRRYFAVLPECASVIGDPQVRNRGTIGGSISHADPSADMPGAVRALKAEIRVRGPNGERTVAADDFFLGTFTTALEPGEMVTEIRFPLPPARTGSAYTKLANKASHYAVAGCAAVVTLGADGACTAASVVITGAGTMPTRASAVEAALMGKQLDEATVAEAASHAAEGLELMEDIHGSKQYRAQMAAVMARRAILKAAERARG